MGSSNPGVVNTTSTSQSGPPAWLQPYQGEFLQRSSELAYSPETDWAYQPYQGQRVADIDPASQQGMQAMQQAATNDFGGLGQAYGQTVSGGMLGANPFINAQFGNAARGMVDQYKYGTAPANQAQAVYNRSLGNTGRQQYADMQRFGLGQNLSGLAADMYGQNYANERSNQMQAFGMAPQMQGMGFQGANALMGIGDFNRNYQQQLIDASRARYTEEQQVPFQRMNVAGNSLSSALGANQVTSSSNPTLFTPNRGAGAVGGAALGYGLADQYGGTNVPPWLGALLGGAGGYFL